MKITLVISGDSNYDQRLQKVCNTLAKNQYDVTLVSFRKKYSSELSATAYRQIRLNSFFSGKMFFYAEVNFRLLLYLLFNKHDVVVANDIDTIPAVFFASFLKRSNRLVDMHEFFTEMPEMLQKLFKRKIWLAVERFFLPHFPLGYTVTLLIAEQYQIRYGLNYTPVCNFPTYAKPNADLYKKEKFLLYQGTIVEGRYFEEMILAARELNYPLVIAGNGGQFTKLEAFVREGNHSHVKLLGWVNPQELRQLTSQAWIGFNLLTDASLSYVYTAANRFFDYLQAGLPQISSAFPVYQEVNKQYESSVLLENISVKSVISAVKSLENAEYYRYLAQNAFKAAEIYTWEREEEKLLSVYQKLGA